MARTPRARQHTLGILMTYDGELRLRVCRNYQPKMEAPCAAWGELVPTTVARNVRDGRGRCTGGSRPRPRRDAQDASTAI